MLQQSTKKVRGLSQSIYTSKGIVSLLLPDNFNYERKNNANDTEPILKIYVALCLMSFLINSRN